MRIVIKRSRGAPSLPIFLPLRMLDSPLIWRMLPKHSDSGRLDEYMPAVAACCGCLRRHVKAHGHFCLAEIENSDGFKIRITV